VTSLLESPVKDVLDRLYDDARATHAAAMERARTEGGPDRGPGPGAGGPGDSLAFFERVKDAYLAVSRGTGTLLYALVVSSGARSVVEFGTSFAISTICLAAGVKDNGGGLVIGSEFLPNKVETARANLADAGLADLVDVRAGDARVELMRDLPEAIDLVFLDGAKEMYVGILQGLETRLRPRALVVADNARRGVGYLDYVRDSGRFLSTGFDSEDVEVSLFLG
jgi:predicted O-methyltransferase YrrM